MNIASMIKREDFFRILIKTIEIYFVKVRNKNVVVSFSPDENLELFRVFSLGNIVSRENKPKGAKQFLEAEYNIRKNIIKYIIGKVLIYFLVYTKKCGSTKSIFITQNVIGINELISPQNRSIRFYNYDENIVDCIIKDGFTDSYFNNQILFRKKYHYSFMVPILADGEGWFRESILHGHPLARVTNENKYKKGIEDALNGIKLLVNDTIEYIPSKLYIPALIKKAIFLTESARIKKQISTYDNCVFILAHIELHMKDISFDIPISMSHGDLQTGNIWIDNNGMTLIYDWETAAKRSVWYDCATLIFSLRRINGWKKLLRNKTPFELLRNDPYKNRSQEEFGYIKKILILEDYLFLIEDMMELPNNWGNTIFDLNIKRISKLLTDAF